MEWEEGGRPGDPEGRDDEGKTNLDLIEMRKNQNKQILLKLSFVLFSDRRPEPFKIRIAIGGKMDKQEDFYKSLRVCGQIWVSTPIKCFKNLST